MSRLDLRVDINLAAKVLHPSTSEVLKTAVTIKDLSLGGALILGLNSNARIVTLKSDYPDLGNIQLNGEIVRRQNGFAAMKLLFTDQAAMNSLWTMIRKNIHCKDVCHYCGHEFNPLENKCDKCGMLINFESDDYLSKHFKFTFMERLIGRIGKLDLTHLQKIMQLVDRELIKSQGICPDEAFVGTSKGMLAVFDMIRKVAPTNMNVLILGESGTGKELTAKAIHERSERKEKPFAAINAAAIPESLMEAELFGYEKGAFTGAHMARKGKFELADGGTVFLDEIGELPSSLQAKLLRFLEDRVVERIGGKGGKKVDVRIVAATNCDLDIMKAHGDFRNDLFFRLSAFTIKLPPLRSRGEDKVVLARYFLKKISESENVLIKGFSEEALKAIKSYDWPGNVRELINKIRRGIVMTSGDYISSADMELEYAPVKDELDGLRAQVSQTQKEVVLRALEDSNFIIARAAKTLGISRPSLYALMKKNNIQNALTKY